MIVLLILVVICLLLIIVPVFKPEPIEYFYIEKMYLSNLSQLKHVFSKKKKLKLKQRIIGIVENFAFCLVVVLVYLSGCYNSTSVLSIYCFQLYDFLLNNCYPCSINFRYQITNLQSCSFRYAKDLDDNLVVNSVLLASLPITLLLIILSVLPSFTQVYNWVFFLPLFLYFVCGLKSSLCINGIENVKLIFCFVIQMIAFLVFSCLLWILLTRDFSEPNFLLECMIRYGLLIVPALLSRIIILHDSKRFQYDKLQRVYYPNTVGEKGNYFEIFEFPHFLGLGIIKPHF